MGRRCETCLAVREIISLLKTGCFLLDTHHRDVSAFSRIALYATFSIKFLFIPLISLLVDRNLTKFWDLEAIEIKAESSCDPDDQAMQHFKSSVRFNSGRYEVGVLKEGPYTRVK
ncbi:hypothetical protein TNCV_2143831 [Trichonephila clavipes]|nr:hypothetical protein TNCV_2143831 [Trichonephila clavipes]